MTTEPPVRLALDAGVATIVLARPPANALGTALIEELSDALDEAERQEARALVVASEVPGYFAAGADLKQLARADSPGFARYLDALQGVIERLPRAPFVSVAAIDGHALGGGLELAMACTLRVASARARLGLPEVKLGLLPGAGGTQRLPRLVGRGPALDLLLTGRSAGAEEASRLGLVDRLAEDGEAEATARTWAAAFAAGPQDALAAIVRCVDASRDGPLEQGLRVERDELVGLFPGPDAREGIAAFLEKRAPRFGRRPAG